MPRRDCVLCVYARRDPLRIVSRRDVIIVYMNSSSLMLRYVYISLHISTRFLYISAPTSRRDY